jgi:hypothetical protein
MALVFPSTHLLVKHKLTLLRDKRTEPKKFRELVRELTVLMAYEVTADLALAEKEVTPPMGQARGAELAEKIGLVPVLRAGLGMVEGFWDMMPTAASPRAWFIPPRISAVSIRAKLSWDHTATWATGTFRFWMTTITSLAASCAFRARPRPITR